MSDSLKDFLESDTWKAYQKKLAEKEKFVKTGPNVIHIEHLDSMFTDQEFIEIENELNDAGLELSRFDKSGVMYANMDEYNLVTFIAVGAPMIFDLIKGIGINATWDLIKSLILKLCPHYLRMLVVMT